MPTSKYKLIIPLGIAVCLSSVGDLSLFAGLVTRLDVVGISLAQVGIILSIHRLIRIPANPLAGFLVDRFGRRKPLFIFGMVLAVASSTAYGLVHGFWPFLLARLAWGVAWMLINITGITMVLDLSSPDTRGWLSGLYNTGIWAGYALGPLLGGFLIDSLAFRNAMLICAAISAVGLLVVFLLPETSLVRSIQSEDRLSVQFDFQKRWRVFISSWMDLLRDFPESRTALVLFCFTQFAGDGIMLSSMALLLSGRFGNTISIGSQVLRVATASGALLALRSVLAAVTGPLAGRVSDNWLGRPLVISVSFSLGILSFVILAFSVNIGWALVGIILGALSGGALLSALTAYMGDHIPAEKMGSGIGLFATAGDVGSTLGPLVAYSLVAVMDLKWVYLLCTLVFVAGLGLSWRQATVLPAALEQ
ncbi:MAG TPA: MFS transporter [Anaerolineaceae bacterium]|nr:MFS transporter [Anaerolineaceae bacterium]